MKSPIRIGLALCALVLSSAWASETVPTTPAGIEQELRSFATVATLLHVAAHPDDENTALITYFARGRGYRTAYLSLTRGDGGQNEIGPEFDEKLGVARTQELLAARQIDGGRQFFTRAIDFGFSKTPEETLKFWDRDKVLADVVRIIRQYRPDVVVTRFPIPPGSGGHGHHTASGILGVEAFKLAGDPKAYPEQFKEGLTVWQPKRVAWNGGGGGRGGAPALNGPTVRVDIGGLDPVTGDSFGAIAGKSRGRHITQGFGGFGGGGGSGGPNMQSFVILGGDAAEKDLFDGVDTTWKRFENGGAEIALLAEKAIADFKRDDAAASVPALLAIRAKLSGMVSDPVVADKRAQLDRILQACLGLTVETVATQAEVVPGEELKLRHSVTMKAAMPVKWLQPKARGLQLAPAAKELSAGKTESADSILRVPGDLAVTQPYWLREEGSSGIFRVDDPKLIGTPENAPSLPIEYSFEVGGQTLTIVDEPVFPERERRRKVDIIPPVTIRFASDVFLVRPGASAPVTVELKAARAKESGTLRLEVPSGWKVSPEKKFEISKAGETTKLTFNVSAPDKQSSERVRAVAVVNGKSYSNQRTEINYAHLPFLLLQPPARARIVSANFEAKGKNVGYLPGAGDSLDQALAQLGYNVTTLSGADLTEEKLKGLDAVVIGVRAFNERTDLAGTITNLFNFVENGGVVIAQYNRPNGLKTQKLGPYNMSIQGSAPQLRVTDETAPVTFLAPEHAALNSPNKITQADFEGWFQERATYVPSSWDKEHYETILAMSDPGEPPLQSSLLVAKHGKGYYVYSGVAFFRQLPAGNPGAYRLFANLVSLGK